MQMRQLARTKVVASAWRAYENAMLMQGSSRSTRARSGKGSARDAGTTAKYRIQAHYLTHGCWLGERRLMTAAKRAVASGVALYALHGSRDPVCAPDNLHRLMRAVPRVHGRFVEAGHLASDPRLAEGLAAAIDEAFALRASQSSSSS